MQYTVLALGRAKESQEKDNPYPSEVVSREITENWDLKIRRRDADTTLQTRKNMCTMVGGLRFQLDLTEISAMT